MIGYAKKRRSTVDDPFDLARFVTAQDRVYAHVLAELRAGAKRSHWMWFVFPQLAGLGYSSTARRYALRGAAEARAYLGHALLGARLRECVGLVLEAPVFAAALRRWFDAQADPRTLELLSKAP
jgi:uncharacterized protein (DUF1810 family)